MGAILISVGSASSGSTITLTDSSRTVLVSWQADKEFSSVLISCADLTEGETYTLDVDGMTTEITMDSLIYTSVSSSPGGGMDGGNRSMNNDNGTQDNMRTQS